MHEVDGRIRGVLPLAHIDSLLFGSALVSLPFAVYGGVAADDDAAALALEHEAQQLAQRLRVAHLELRHVDARHADWPTQHLYVTFRKPIEPSDEANMLAIPRKQRAMVRKGIKNALRSRGRCRMWTASSRCTPTTCTAMARRPCPSATSRRCAVNSAAIARC